MKFWKALIVADATQSSVDCAPCLRLDAVDRVGHMPGFNRCFLLLFFRDFGRVGLCALTVVPLARLLRVLATFPHAEVT